MTAMSRNFHRHWARGVTAVISVMALAWLGTGAAGAAGAAGVSAERGAGSGVGSPASTGASNVRNLGASGWQVQSSANAAQTGAQISTPGFRTSGWLPVANDDAGAPGTEIEALAQNGRCPGDPSLQPVNQSAEGTHSVFYS